MNKNNRKKRYLWFLMGIIINAFGIAMITQADMGTSPISSTAYVLSLEYPLSLGAFTFLLNSIFIFIQILILRRDFPPIQLLQIIVNIIFSIGIDGAMSLVSRISSNTPLTQWLMLLIGSAVLGFGIAIEVAPRVLMVPGEGLVQAITVKYNRNFGRMKIVFDSLLVLVALILSFYFFGEIKGLGIGTVVSAVLVGRFVSLYKYHLKLITKIEDLRRH
ncbi:MAG: DUF6198 family protein [Tissierellia bacterium]|nr:DUF6198 family protein [Tissierellia bacterium]